MEYGDSDDADADMMHAPENAWAAAEGGHIHTLHDVLQQRKASLGKLSFPFFSIFPMVGLPLQRMLRSRAVASHPYTCIISNRTLELLLPQLLPVMLYNDEMNLEVRRSYLSFF